MSECWISLFIRLPDVALSDGSIGWFRVGIVFKNRSDFARIFKVNDVTP